MKKIKAFTLLEMLIVIGIIWLISASLTKFTKYAWSDKSDTWRDAVNIIYKEMGQYIKDFQRNKIREDSWVEHKIEYLHLNFGNETGITGNSLSIWNIFIYETWWVKTWHIEWTTLISWQTYTAYQYLKASNRYRFYIRVKNTGDVTPILISNNWKLFSWNMESIINETNEELTWIVYEFLICGGRYTIVPIWKISINAVTKNTKLERCETEKYAWIDCDEFASCY